MGGVAEGYVEGVVVKGSGAVFRRSVYGVPEGAGSEGRVMGCPRGRFRSRFRGRFKGSVRPLWDLSKRGGKSFQQGSLSC